MQNKSIHLNNHLFAQLEKLREEDLKGEALTVEIGRARAITDIAKNIIENRKLVLEGVKVAAQYSISERSFPTMLKEGIV